MSMSVLLLLSYELCKLDWVLLCLIERLANLLEGFELLTDPALLEVFDTRSKDFSLS